MSATSGLAALLLATASACTPDFQNPTTISDLRLLAVRADPPEVLIDLQAVMATGALVEPLPEITLSPLIVDPLGAGRAVSYRVQLCVVPLNEEARGGTQRPGRFGDAIGDAPCDPDAGVIAEGTALPIDGGIVPLVASFTPTLPFLIEAARVDPLGIELGLPVTVTFTISAGSESVVAFKRVIFSPRLLPEQAPNQNPVARGTLARVSRSATAAPFGIESPPVSRGGRNLLISVNPALAEAYPARNFSLSERRFYTESVPQETLRYSFYASRGTFSPGTVTNQPSPARTNQILNHEVVYQPPADASTLPGPADVFIVVRDERGGSSFLLTRLLLE